MNVVMLTVLLQLSPVAAAPDSYEAAHADAMKQGRPLVVLVGSDTCPACQKMKSAVIPELQRNGALKHVSFATVNVEKQGKLAKELTTGGLVPQLVMYRKSSNGWLRSTLRGAHSTSEVSAFLNRTKTVSYTSPATTGAPRPVASYSP